MERYNTSLTGGYAQIPVADKTVSAELSGDFTLPDYQPEIKRLLRVTASVLPPSKYIGDGEAEFTGIVDYYVLYIGSDNGVYCVPLSTDYKIDLPFESSEPRESGYFGGFSGNATISADMISGRVTAPRRLGIKCRLKARAEILAEMPLEDGFGADGEEIQRLNCSARVTRRLWGAGEMLRVSDEMICESGESELRVIAAEGKTLIGETVALGGAVSCRGDLYLKLLLCREGGGVPYTATRKIPISQTVSIDGVTPGTSLSARGTVSEMGIVVEEGRIGIDAGIIIEVEGCREENISYVKDIYSTARSTEGKYKNVTLLTGGEEISGNFTLSDSLPLDDVNVARGSRVIDLCGSVSAEECSFDADKCTVYGKARFSLLSEKDGEYSVSDIELPFVYRTATSGELDRAVLDGEIISARARIDDDRIGIDAEIGIRGNASREETAQMLAEVGFGEEIERDRGGIVICYPSGDDSLWSVAKRYGVPLDALTSGNSIERSFGEDPARALEGVKYLVVG